VVRRLSAAGVAVIFISHFLDEVLETAGIITIMRNGRHVDTTAASETTVDRLIVGMLGRDLAATFPPKPSVSPDAPVVLSVEDLCQPGVLRDIRFEARAGEIVGLFGLVGSGRSELAHAIAGAAAHTTGTIAVNGVALGRGVRKSMRAGVTLLPESRKDQGLFIELSQHTNTSSTSLVRYAGWMRGGLRKERAASRGVLETVGVEPLMLDAAVASLSGGNQQKVLFAKCLINDPTVLVLDEPTRGVDIGAKRAIYDLIVDLARRGRAIVMISSELEEVTQLCHRVLIMRDGQLIAEFDGGFEQHEEILSTAFGYDVKYSDSTAPVGERET
jgi:rhamnose transport system ATP-binding protein